MKRILGKTDCILLLVFCGILQVLETYAQDAGWKLQHKRCVTKRTTQTMGHSSCPFGFSASFCGKTYAPANPFPLKLVSSNIKDSFNAASFSYKIPCNGIYFAEICAGLVGGQPAKLALMQCGKIVMGLYWESNIHCASETICRSGLLELHSSVTQQLALNGGTVFSDHSETALNVFSVSDAMSDDAAKRTVHAVGSATSEYVGVVRLRATIGASSGVFDEASSTYTCTTDGLYFVSYTVGAHPSDRVAVDLEGFQSVSGSGKQCHGSYRTFELVNNGFKHNGIVTVSRSVLHPCTAGSKLHLKLKYGKIADVDDYKLVTFSAFPYLPRHTTGQAWSLLLDHASYTTSGPMDPFQFNIIAYNGDHLYNEQTRTVTIQKCGYYYVYIGTGTRRTKPAYFSLQKNGKALIVINHQSRNLDAEETVGHGTVVALKTNDVLKVVGEVETFSFSSTYGLQTSFFGMLVYGP